MRIGYARVTADPYDQAEQKVLLQHLGCQEIRLEPGTSRAALDSVLGRATAGDVVVVTALSRLAHSLQDLRSTLHELTAKGVELQVSEQVFDLHRSDQSLTGAVELMASFEGELAAQRADLARTTARSARGRRPGRKPKLSPAQESDITRLYEQGVRSVEELAEDYGIGTSTVYRILDRSSTETVKEAINDDDLVHRY